MIYAILAEFLKIADEIKKNVYLHPHLRIGVWRSWLAYLHGVQVVVSSSLTTPT